jgi:HK97 family phage major capsid protein
MPTLAEQLELGLKGLSDKIDTTSQDYKSTLEKSQNQVTELERQLKEMGGRIEKLSADTGGGVNLPGSEDNDKKKFMFSRAYRAIIQNDWSEAKHEQEVITETKKRAVMQASTDSLGGFLIPIQQASGMIEELRNELILNRLKVRTLNNLPYGIYKFAKKKSHASAYAKSELGAAQRTGMTFGEMSLDPRIVSAYVPVSEVLLNNANQSVESIIREDLRLAVREEMERQFFFGVGGDNEVLGISKQTGVMGANSTGVDTGDQFYFQSDAAGGHELTHEDIIMKLEAYLSDNNAMPSDTGTVQLAANPGVSRMMRTTKYWTYDASAATAAQKENLPFRNTVPLTRSQVSDIIGYNIVEGNTIPITGANQGVTSSTIASPSSGTAKLSFGFFGDWNQVFHAMFAGMSITASREASDVVAGKFYNAFTQNQVWIKINMMHALGIRHTESMVVMNNLKTRRA